MFAMNRRLVLPGRALVNYLTKHIFIYLFHFTAVYQCLRNQPLQNNKHFYSVIIGPVLH